MLKKRIIPCLDIKEGRTVKGIHFEGLRDAGDPVALARKYAGEGADELVFLDITATQEKRKTLLELVQRIAREINIPFTVGGGISSAEDAALLIRSGADKVSINSAAVLRPQLISEIADRFGRQCVVVAIDTRKTETGDTVFIQGGRKATGIRTVDWARQAEAAGAGELLLTSMDNDGVQQGFALDVTDAVCAAVNLPVIASGGAGSKEHFRDLFKQSRAHAALAASVFHFGEVPIMKLKSFLKSKKIPVR